MSYTVAYLRRAIVVLAGACLLPLSTTACGGADESGVTESAVAEAPAAEGKQWGSDVGKAGKAGKAGKSGKAGRGEASAVGGGAGPAEARYVTFAVNVHDWVNLEDSADTLVRLMDIYERHGVQGDFYVTAPMVRAYAEDHPDVLQRLEKHGVNYHVRAPHPMASGFEARLKGLSGDALTEALEDYETYRLDMSTGDLDRSQAGGYRYVKKTLGRAPTIAAAQLNNDTIDAASHAVFKDLGATMMVLHHEEGTDPQSPYEWVDGLLARPSVFSITRWGDNQFWWNAITFDGENFNPSQKLESEVGAYDGGGTLFVTALIHENNFYRRGSTPWSGIFYSQYSGGTRIASDPPWDLDGADASTARSQSEQDTIWAAYEEMVDWAADNMNVVTAAEIYEMAPAP